MPREGHYKPRLYDEELNMDQINFICVLYHNYRYGKRPLMLEEINGIIGLKRDRVPPSNQMMWGIYQKLDDPQSPLMREFEERSSSFSEKKIVGLLDEIERLHSELRGRDKIFKDIAENLSGL